MNHYGTIVKNLMVQHKDVGIFLFVIITDSTLQYSFNISSIWWGKCAWSNQQIFIFISLREKKKKKILWVLTTSNSARFFKKKYQYFEVGEKKSIFEYTVFHEHFYIATDKVLFFIQKMLISFLFLNKNICCGYSLEALLMSTHNICFH